MVISNAMLIGLIRSEFKFEMSHANFEIRTAHTVASYVCAYGTTFQVMTNVGYRLIKGENVAYKNASCVGDEKWDALPNCI
jgi:hypothetical protein